MIYYYYFLPDFDMTKLWCPPQAINEIGKPISDLTNDGLDTLIGPTPRPNCPNSFDPQVYNSPSTWKYNELSELYTNQIFLTQFHYVFNDYKNN